MSWKKSAITRPGSAVFGRGLAAVWFSLSVATAAVPDYKLGDVAQEDVVAPMQLLVVNPEASGTLKQQVASQVLLVVRHSPQIAADVESDLWKKVSNARSTFYRFLQVALAGRDPAVANIAGTAFSVTVSEVARDLPPEFPLEALARAWVRGETGEALVESLLQPVRELMLQPILNQRTDATFAGHASVQVLSVRNLNAPPTTQELGEPTSAVSPDTIISLGRARRLVEARFPSGQESSGRFAASLLRPNAMVDVPLTETLRSRRMEGVTVNDIYEPAQVIVRKGEVIDRKALSAFAIMREKSLIGALQTKLEQERLVAGLITHQTKWVAAILGAICVALFLIFRRLRTRTSTELVLGQSPSAEAWNVESLPGGAAGEEWQRRALLAEHKVERAHEAIRTGVLGWMREKVFRTMSRQRGELLSVQKKAEAEMRELEQRLEQLHTPWQERISSYEKRIEELEKDLAVKGEENRQLIGARISVARQQLLAARERSGFGTN